MWDICAATGTDGRLLKRSDYISPYVRKRSAKTMGMRPPTSILGRRNSAALSQTRPFLVVGFTRTVAALGRSPNVPAAAGCRSQQCARKRIKPLWSEGLQGDFHRLDVVVADVRDDDFVTGLV